MARRKSQDNNPPAAENTPPTQQTPEGETASAVTPPAQSQTPEVPAASGDQTPPAAGGEQTPQRRPLPDPFGIAKDYVAGVQLLESRKYRQMQIRFDEKPSAERIEEVKDAGFRWNGQDKVWVKPIQQEAAMQTRIEAERLFKDLAEKIRQEKGEGRAY